MKISVTEFLEHEKDEEQKRIERKFRQLEEREINEYRRLISECINEDAGGRLYE